MTRATPLSAGEADKRLPAFEPGLFRARFAVRIILQELYGIYRADDPHGVNQALERFADLYACGQMTAITDPRIPRHREHDHRPDQSNQYNSLLQVP